jgi:hypothetical protein
MAGVNVTGGNHGEGPGGSRVFVAIDAKGGLSAGTMHAVRFTPSGASYVPATTKAFADVKELAQHLDPQAAAAAKLADVDDVVDDDVDDDPDGTGTAMALDEGTMGKKDPDRAAGQYKMKMNPHDEPLARRQAIERARSAGVLGSTALQPGGSFASLTGTGDISSGFEAEDPDRGDLVGEPLHSVVGLASTPTRDQIVVFADAEAPASRLLAVLATLPDGAVIAVERKGAIAALPLVFDREGGRPIGNLTGDLDGGVELTVDVGGAEVLVGAPRLGDMTPVKVDAGKLDHVALEKALGDYLKEAVSADRRDLVVQVRDDAKVAQVVPALDAALSAGIRAVRLESKAEGRGSGRSDPAPSVGIGESSAVGDLDKAIIRRYMKRNVPKIQYCYEKQLLVTLTLEGTVSTQFFIAPNGSVVMSKATGVDPAVASCVADVIRGIEFPKPKGAGGVQVNYPFTFRSTGG